MTETTRQVVPDDQIGAYLGDDMFVRGLIEMAVFYAMHKDAPRPELSLNIALPRALDPDARLAALHDVARGLEVPVTRREDGTYIAERTFAHGGRVESHFTPERVRTRQAINRIDAAQAAAAAKAAVA